MTHAERAAMRRHQLANEPNLSTLGWPTDAAMPGRGGAAIGLLRRLRLWLMRLFYGRFSEG